MRILAWNLNHRTKEKTLRKEIIEVISGQNPNIFCFTEFVDGPSRISFKQALLDLGYNTSISSNLGRNHNQVLIATKQGHKLAKRVPPLLSPSYPANVHSVLVDDPEIEVLGMRIPDFSAALPKKRLAWNWILESAAELRARPSILIGDFNTAPEYSVAKCGDRLKKLEEIGFTHATPPADQASYWTLKGKACRIDHAFFSSHFKIQRSEYLQETNGLILVSRERPYGLSDHAALVVDFDWS